MFTLSDEINQQEELNYKGNQGQGIDVTARPAGRTGPLVWSQQMGYFADLSLK